MRPKRKRVEQGGVDARAGDVPRGAEVLRGGGVGPRGERRRVRRGRLQRAQHAAPAPPRARARRLPHRLLPLCLRLVHHLTPVTHHDINSLND